MARANFGLAAATVGAVTAFGVNPAQADIWLHQGTNNTSFATSEQMTGNVTGIRANIGESDNLWSFTAVATSQFITITSGESSQPATFSVYDRFGNPFAVGSGFNDIFLNGVNMTVDIGAANVGQQIVFAIGNYGVVPEHNGASLYNVAEFGQIDPQFIAPWNSTGGQNNFGAETRQYQISGITGVPTAGTLVPLALAGLVATRRRR